MYYRNKVEIKGIEPHSLWEFDNKFFILVNNDTFVSVPETEKEKFYRITDKNQGVK